MISYLNGRGPEDDPFFAYIAFTSPHDPRTPPPPFDAMYDPHEIILPPNFMPEHPFDIGVSVISATRSWPRIRAWRTRLASISPTITA